ncbi:MAG: sulfotransferase [Bacteroidetes bacterium]|nr:sulfotransferase [Bacteroidota bacterium]
MTYYLTVFVGGLLAFGLIRWGRGSFYRLALSSTGVLNVMLGNQDEDEKLEELQRETLKLIIRLFTFIGLVLAAGLLFWLLLYAYENLFAAADGNALPSLDSWQSILALSLGATVPFIIPFKKSPSDYSELAMLLHRMVLNNYQLGWKLHQRELKKHKQEGPKDFVIVSGLARAGTTSFMNKLAEDPIFQSLNYSNMPFLLAPNTWSKFSKSKSGNTKERSHKDGIQIGMDSNEALEEYFWKALANDRFIEPEYLKEYSLSADEIQSYLDYQSIIRQEQSQLYLAKNNNFLLRYASLREELKDFSLILLFRQPLSHAASLLEKHLQYCKLQKEDPFVLEYMDWLGHHEFGLHQKAFLFGEGALIEGDKSSLNYWLQQWINYYQYALSFEDENLLFVAYEDYCSAPVMALNRVRKHLGFSALKSEIPAYTAERNVEGNFDTALLNQALSLYKKLQARASE